MKEEKIAVKVPKTHSKSHFARANENLVAPLYIVLTQSRMNYENWVVHQMKEEKRIFSFIYIHLIKQIYDYDSKKLQWNSVSFILGRTV